MSQKHGDPEGNSHDMKESDRDPAPGEQAASGNGSGSKSTSRLPGRQRFDRMAVSPTSGAGGAYQGAMEAALAVVVATGLGYWADSHFGTEPLWLLVGAVVGFAAMVVRLLRMAKLIEEPTFDDSQRAENQEHRESKQEKAEAAEGGGESNTGEPRD